METISGKRLEEIYSLIGRIAISFALAEQSLDECVRVIYNTHTESHLFEKKIPRMLVRKIEFLRKCFGKITVLSKYKDDGLLTLQQIFDLADDRNFLIHGAVIPHGFETEEMPLKFHKINYDPGVPPDEERIYTWSRFQEIEQNLSMAAVNAMFLAHALKTK